MEAIALTILILFSLAGFLAIFFTTFGTLIILLGTCLYAILTNFSILTVKSLVIIFILYFFGEVSEYLFIIFGAKKFGASNVAVIGALVGGILGAIFGIGFLGVGVILGTFLGIFLGAFLATYLLTASLMRKEVDLLVVLDNLFSLTIMSLSKSIDVLSFSTVPHLIL